MISFENRKKYYAIFCSARGFFCSEYRMMATPSLLWAIHTLQLGFNRRLPQFHLALAWLFSFGRGSGVIELVLKEKFIFFLPPRGELLLMCIQTRSQKTKYFE